MISATDLSNYIVSEAYRRGMPITQLKLQKILYYIQGKYLALYRRPLFPEDIEAWVYGPVVREVYVKYVSNGALPLKPDSKGSTPNLSQEEKECVDSVLDEKLAFSASTLVGMTHSESPWLEHAEEVKNGAKPTITIDRIYRFFTEEGR